MTSRAFTIPAGGLGTRRPPSAHSLLWPAALIGFLLLVGVALQRPSDVRLAVGVVAAVFLVGLATRSAVAPLLVLIVWLTALGSSRRLVSELAPVTRTDPLLLVSPLVLGLLAAAAIRRGALRERTTLTKGVLALSVLSLLGAVNPLQGSLVGGIGGLLFVLVPMLAFWIGRAYVDDRTLSLLFKLVAVLGLGAATYGLVQISSGFPSWDRKWLSDVSYASLNVNGVIRPFASFSSASEYGIFLAVTIVVWLAMGRRALAVPLTVAALGLLVPALVLESARGAAIALLATVGLLVGAHRRLPLGMSVGLGFLVLVALVIGLRHYGPTTYGSGTSSTLISHEAQGLSDPLNPQTSTAGAHISLIRNGLTAAFTHPLGQGLGVVTIAGAKFGGLNQNTEADPSNVGVALGLPGLVSYLVVVIAGMVRLYGIARRRRDGLALAALGVVTVTGLEWLNGGQYAVAVLPWLVLGWADRPRREHEWDGSPEAFAAAGSGGG
jgi:hypothetical protein